MWFFKKHKVLTVLMCLFFALPAIDIISWRIDVNSNKRILNNDIRAVMGKDTSTPIVEDCHVNEVKWSKTTSCTLTTGFIIDPNGDMNETLAYYFEQLEKDKWDANFEEFKTELIDGHSRFKDQGVRFYKDDYDPDGDLDFIDVYRVDNGVTLGDTPVVSTKYSTDQSGLIVIRFQRDQRSSLAHFLIGQFIDF
ncbi:hypothetical protein KC951_02105 [Candidatus Saccharibacteria bacterium]|nr:hypothetical protein [Candidatus Saccharibacteria bacterium]